MKPEPDFLKKIPRDLVPVSDIDVRELAEIYEETDVYLSIYLPTASKDDAEMNDSYVQSRIRSINKAMRSNLQTNFEQSLEMVKEYIEGKPIPGEKGRIIFVSSNVNLLHVYRIGLKTERKMVLDTSPFLLPLAKLRDDYEDYVLLLMDSQQAKLFMVRSNVMTIENSDSIDLMQKHKKGGMSQMRFNRLRRGAISAFVDEIIEDLEDLEELKGSRGIVVAGPGEAKKQLIESLPQHLKELVVGVDDISMETPMGGLLELGERLTEKNERETEKALVEELRSSIMKGKPSAYGASKVRSALKNGRASVLILLDNTSIPGWICERCQSITERAKRPEKCPNCSGPTSEVDVVEEIFELAERTGARTEFVKESTFLESIGGIGAILRY